MNYIIERQTETLDEIVSRNYGSSFGYLEIVLKANKHLYESPIFLPFGTIIELPDVPKKANERKKLW